MKKLLLAATALLALSGAARADLITLSAQVDGGAISSTSSNTGSLTVSGIALGPFSFNSANITSQAILPGGGILNTQVLNLQQTNTGNHTLVIDVLASGLIGTASLQSLLSSFSVSALTAGWDAREQTFINGVLLADTGVFTASSDSAFSFNNALLTNPFTADVRYTIHSVGVGGFNGGIAVGVGAVPEPSTWAMMILGFLGVGGLAMRKRRREGQAFRLV